MNLLNKCYKKHLSITIIMYLVVFFAEKFYRLYFNAII